LAVRRGLIVKVFAVAALLSAGAVIDYYYGEHLPQPDADGASARTLEQTEAYAQKRAAQLRFATEQQQTEQRRAAAKVAAEGRYQSCLVAADSAHDTSWAAACKRMADKLVAEHADCLSKPKLSQGYCDAAYRMRDGSPHCILPVAVASDLDGGRSSARMRCLQEREAALR